MIELTYILSVFLAGIITNKIIVDKIVTRLLILNADGAMHPLYAGIATTLVTLCSMAVTYPIYNRFLKSLGLYWLQIVIFVLLAAGLVVLSDFLFKRFLKAFYEKLGGYLIIVGVSSVVIGATLIITVGKLNYVGTLINTLGVGVGFIAATLMFMGVHAKLRTADVPEFLKGIPITLISAALISLPFLCLGEIIG